MVAMRDPRPTCFGFTPPVSSVGLAAPEIIWDTRSWKLTRPFLNPWVLTFATLFPMTSILVWWFTIPDTPE
jgi:hypothetical protein